MRPRSPERSQPQPVIRGTFPDLWHSLASRRDHASSYVSRVLRLTLLAPDIVDAILDGRQPAEMFAHTILRGAKPADIPFEQLLGQEETHSLHKFR